MTIRPRRPEDLPACVEVLAQVHRADDYPQVWQADSEGWLDPPGTTAAWVAEFGGRIAGHVSLISDAEGLKLSRLFVGPSAQRQGLARRLMAVAVAWGQERSMDVVLEVFADSPAVTVYERLGWRYLASGQASWTGRDGSSPAVHYYAAPRVVGPAENHSPLPRRPDQDGPMTKHEVAVKTAGQEIAASRWDVTATASGPGDSAAQPTIVFLHAGVCDRRSWYRTAEQLTDLGSLIAYDRRGFGESPVSAGNYRDLDDLWAVIDQAGAGPAAAARPVWLVGSSMGGLLALDAALTSPERVAGLVLFAPAISGAPEDDDVELDPGSKALFEQLGAARQAGDQEERLRLQTRLWLDGPAAGEPRVQGPARELALAMNKIILANDFDDEAGAAGVDAWSKLEQVRPPVTVAWGDLDLPIIIEELEQLVARLPRAERRVLPGTAHLPYLEQPDQVAAIVREAIG